jgi:hypothetical protein
MERGQPSNIETLGGHIKTNRKFFQKWFETSNNNVFPRTS